MEKKTTLVLFPCASGVRETLTAAVGEMSELLFREPDWTVEEYRAALKKAHVIIGEPRNEDFAYCENLEMMHSPSSGVNYYMDGGKFPKGAILCCMTGGYGNVLSEHLLALVLSLCRRLPEYQEQQKAHKWELRRYDKQLEDCTLLILGAGDIGTMLAQWMRPMVGTIIGVRRVARTYPGCYDKMVTLDQLDAVLALGVPYETHIYSAHRTPVEARDFALNARANGFGCIIAAAGMAAHLAGAIAANTTLPVIGIPCKGGMMDGLDALLATVQMPSGIPVATVAINGGVNAALLAAQIIAVGEPELAAKLDAKRVSDAETVLKKDAALQAELNK